MAKKKSKPDNEPTQDAAASPTDPALADRTSVSMEYAGVSQMDHEGEQPRLRLYGNLKREPVFLDGVVKDPIHFREALAAVYAVVGSDFRYVPKDRTAYNAYRRMKNQTANLGAWQAQQAYFDWLARNDPYAFCIFGSSHQRSSRQSFLGSVFQKTKGPTQTCPLIWKRLISKANPLLARRTSISVRRCSEPSNNSAAFAKLASPSDNKPLKSKRRTKKRSSRRKINVPDSWIRGFLQVQSSAMLPRHSFKMKPMDLYNLLRHLRMNKDIKGKRRGILIELVPGEPPRMVLEPWGTVIECGAGIYTGKQSKVIRVWGRRRLMLLRRMLPLVDEVEVHLTGSGLPSFWVLRAGQMTFTFGLTGFNASNWSQAVNFDLLLPREPSETGELKKMVKHLAKSWSGDRAELAKATKTDAEKMLSQLQQGCQDGQLMFDIADNVYRLRPLTSQPLELEKYEFRNRHERSAHDLVLRKGAVTIESRESNSRCRARACWTRKSQRRPTRVSNADVDLRRGVREPRRMHLSDVSATGAEGGALFSLDRAADGACDS